MSRSRQRSGDEQLLLHMGYFTTLAEAEQCLRLMRRAYPNAMASAIPPALLQDRGSGVPTLQPAQGTRSASARDDGTLTDTQVLQILETRGDGGDASRTGEIQGSDISLLRPEDTDTRRALKQAVVQNAAVSFAVQLHWSVQPIDPATVPSLDIFRAYELYMTEGRRDGRCWYCLRLGFFRDAISARQVAHYVRRQFPSVAVVPITEQERTYGIENHIPSSALAAAPSIEPPKPQAVAPPKKAASTPARGRDETLEQTLELLAASELWNDEGSTSDTGVRHLSVAVKKRMSARA